MQTVQKLWKSPVAAQAEPCFFHLALSTTSLPLIQTVAPGADWIVMFFLVTSIGSGRYVPAFATTVPPSFTVLSAFWKVANGLDSVPSLESLPSVATQATFVLGTS